MRYARKPTKILSKLGRDRRVTGSALCAAGGWERDPEDAFFRSLFEPLRDAFKTGLPIHNNRPGIYPWHKRRHPCGL